MLVIEHHVWAMELRVHVSRLLVPHLDRNGWKQNLFVVVCMTLLIKTTQMDQGCPTFSCLCTWPAVYAGQVQSATLLINTPSCTIDEEW